MSKKVIVIGGGIAGMESSTFLTAMGYDVTLLEKEPRLGGHLLQWERLFPTMRLGKEVITFLDKGIQLEKVKVIQNADIKEIHTNHKSFEVILEDKQAYHADAILLATGYQTFDARRKEEYGYGIYDNVITSPDLELWLTEKREIKTTSGNTPKRIGFVHCVGSRDEKVGNSYCSKVCCVTGVKQSIEIKEHLPEAEVFCFYMDLRMFGMQFEALYKEAQEKWGVTFIRGRLSEAAENQDGSLVIKVEDTLAGRPLKMQVDLLVLLVGFEPSEGTKKIGKMLNLDFGRFGFIKSSDVHTLPNVSNIPGVFLAGTCTSCMTISSTITDARSAAATVASYLEGHSNLLRG